MTSYWTPTGRIFAHFLRVYLGITIQSQYWCRMPTQSNPFEMCKAKSRPIFFIIEYPGSLENTWYYLSKMECLSFVDFKGITPFSAKSNFGNLAITAWLQKGNQLNYVACWSEGILNFKSVNKWKEHLHMELNPSSLYLQRQGVDLPARENNPVKTSIPAYFLFRSKLDLECDAFSRCRN